MVRVGMPLCTTFHFHWALLTTPAWCVTLQSFSGIHSMLRWDENSWACVRHITPLPLSRHGARESAGIIVLCIKPIGCADSLSFFYLFICNRVFPRRMRNVSGSLLICFRGPQNSTALIWNQFALWKPKRVSHLKGELAHRRSGSWWTWWTLVVFFQSSRRELRFCADTRACSPDAAIVERCKTEKCPARTQMSNPRTDAVWIIKMWRLIVKIDEAVVCFDYVWLESSFFFFFFWTFKGR